MPRAERHPECSGPLGSQSLCQVVPAAHGPPGAGPPGPLGPTRVLMVNELLLMSVSNVVVETLAVFVMVEPTTAVLGTRTTITKVAVAPDGSEAMPSLTVPVPPGGGLVTEKAGPDVCIWETEVVPAATLSVSATPRAALRPRSRPGSL